jgi:hypothetical protein
MGGWLIEKYGDKVTAQYTGPGGGPVTSINAGEAASWKPRDAGEMATRPRGAAGRYSGQSGAPSRGAAIAG